MKPYMASLLNALLLIILGIWGYFASSSPSLTSFIPVVTGALILICIPGLKKESKIPSHIAVILTFLILFGLIKPLTGSIQREETGALVRILIMMFSSVFAMGFFIKNFRDARRKKE